MPGLLEFVLFEIIPWTPVFDSRRTELRKATYLNILRPISNSKNRILSHGIKSSELHSTNVSPCRSSTQYFEWDDCKRRMAIRVKCLPLVCTVIVERIS